MDGCELPQIHSIDVGIVLEQQLHHLIVPIRAGIVEGDQTPVRGGGGKGKRLKATKSYNSVEKG